MQIPPLTTCFPLTKACAAWSVLHEGFFLQISGCSHQFIALLDCYTPAGLIGSKFVTPKPRVRLLPGEKGVEKSTPSAAQGSLEQGSREGFRAQRNLGIFPHMGGR